MFCRTAEDFNDILKKFMKNEEISFKEIKGSILKIRAYNLLQELNENKFKEIVKFKKFKLESIKDVGKLGEYKTVLYKNNKGKRVKWNYSGARNLSIREASINLRFLLNKSKKITKNIEIILVNDLITNKKIIVDGFHRALFLYNLYQNNPSAIKKILNSRYKVYLIELTSKKASMLFPKDFINT